MMGKIVDLTDIRFGKLVVTKRDSDDKHGRCRWLCACDCGRSLVVSSGNLRAARGTKSCGCLHAELMTTHGMTASPVYVSWQCVIQRCANPKAPGYRHYGGRGITVCDRWLKFENFYADMGDRPAGMSLERKNNNGNYCKENCRWATHVEQSNNKRSNHLLTFRGETKTITEWQLRLGMPRNLLYGRLLAGWSTEEALTTPVGHRRASKQTVVSGVNGRH